MISQLSQVPLPQNTSGMTLWSPGSFLGLELIKRLFLLSHLGLESTEISLSPVLVAGSPTFVREDLLAPRKFRSFVPWVASSSEEKLRTLKRDSSIFFSHTYAYIC